MPTDEDLLSIALAAASEAGEILADRYARGDTGKMRMKGPRSLVTEADTAAEAAVCGRIREAFPGHRIVAEEGTPGAAEGEFTWYVDPLDGTTNFAHGIPHFAVSIGVARGNDLRAAVIYDPLLEEVFAATAESPATRNGTEVSVSSSAKTLEESVIATGFALRRTTNELDGALAVFGDIFRDVEDIRRFGAATLDLAYVGCGRLDGFWEAGLSPWDLAAGLLFARRAGAVATDYEGGNLILETGRIAVSAPGIHGAILARISR